MSRYDELESLRSLLDAGTITQAEFDLEKAAFLEGLAHTDLVVSEAGHRPWGMETHTFCMLMHLSPLAGYTVIPFGGLLVPLVMWLCHKEQSPQIDAHGRVVMNWVLSSMLYFIVSFALVFVLIGFLLLPALVLASLIFMVLGAVKAAEGKLWPYPLSIPFFGHPRPFGHLE